MRKLLLLISLALVLGVGAGVPKPPKMVFRERVMDIGPVPLSLKDTNLVFHYRNEGDSALVIHAMYPGCVCMKPVYSKEPLMPGDSTSFNVHYRFTEIGPFTKTVTISFAAEGGSKLYLTRIAVKGTVVEDPCSSCDD